MGGSTGALTGRRVVVTRAADQQSRLADLLRERGAVPVEVPLIEIVTDESEAARLASLDPAEFEWLVVSSPNGARHVVGAQPHASDAPWGVAAVGTVTAAVLEQAGVAVTLVPQEQSAAGLLAELPTPASPDRSGQVLLVQAAAAEPTMAAGLRAKGWRVTTVAPYRSVPAHPSAGQQLAALAADAVLFASGSAVRAWAGVFGTSTPSLVVAIGPQTAAAAQRIGLKVDLVAADHSLQGLVNSLEHHLAGAL